MAQRQANLALPEYELRTSTFLVRFPMGTPSAQEAGTPAFVLYRTATGKFFYFADTITSPPRYGHYFDSSAEALEWFDKEFAWTRRELEAAQ
jgi:hypothetical protein